MIRVGHKGAGLLAPGNTREAFDAALAVGVDAVEFDVLPERWDPERGVASGELLLAHDGEELRRPTPLTLAEGLAHLEPSGVRLVVDLKLPGYEARVAEALVGAGVAERALVSSTYPASLAVLRGEAPGLRLGWSVPRLSRDPTRSPLTLGPALVAVQAYRRALPRRAAAAVRAGRCDALMAQWRLVSPALVRALEAVGGELFAWTVDEAPRIAALRALGVTGVISNDPRLFAQAGLPAAA